MKTGRRRDALADNQTSAACRLCDTTGKTACCRDRKRRKGPLGMLKQSFVQALFTAALIVSSGAVNDTVRAAEITYRADVLEINSAGVHRRGRLYVRGNATRLDYSHLGMPVIEIELPEKGIRRLLFPAAQTYLEFTRAQAIVDGRKVPCVTTPHQSCSKAGTEEIGGVNAEIWELGTSDRQEPIRLWWDVSRGMTVREEYPSGRRMHGLKREARDYEGFTVEQWEFTYLLPGGRYLGGMAVISPQLNAPVVERRPDGLIRRLVNIKMEPIDASAFQIPQGYRRIELPYPPPPGQTAPSGWQPIPQPSAPEGAGSYAARNAPLPPPSTEGDTARR
ncbi:MAG: hypothetical protein AB7U75_00905 [Hyphomicrobiaceae bacterium]